jgi:ankyrin repeat protein
MLIEIRFTPLLMSCWMKREEMVKVLLSSGANTDAVDKNKRSAIHLSVLRKDDVCVGLLIDAKASLEQPNGLDI